MKVILHDFQDGRGDPFDGVQVDSVDKLCEILDQLQRRAPFILELEGENGYRLTVGIGGPVSCIQYASSDGEPPYLVAVAGSHQLQIELTSYMFLCGGQPTEIPGSHCVPFNVLRSVACHFLDTGGLSAEVEWVEV